MKTILKGILLWTTIFTITLFVIGIDSIVDKGFGLMWMAICIALYNLCRTTLSVKEIYTLLGYKIFKSIKS